MRAHVAGRAVVQTGELDLLGARLGERLERSRDIFGELRPQGVQLDGEPHAPQRNVQGMGFDQYHEPPDELPAQTRTFARLCASLTEEAEAIGWYEQRIAVEQDPEALAVMRNAQTEEFKHFAMDLEFLLRRTPIWRAIAQADPVHRRRHRRSGRRGRGGRRARRLRRRCDSLARWGSAA